MRLPLLSLSAALSLILLAAGGIYLLLALAFWEPDDAKPGSIAYFFGIPSAAKNFPLWKPCGRASYSYRFQDGTSPETYWINYETLFSLVELKGALAEYAKSVGCSLTRQPKRRDAHSDSDTVIGCRTGSREVRVTSSRPDGTAPACIPVTILFVEDLH